MDPGPDDKDEWRAAASRGEALPEMAAAMEAHVGSLGSHRGKGELRNRGGRKTSRSGGGGGSGNGSSGAEDRRAEGGDSHASFPAAETMMETFQAWPDRSNSTQLFGKFAPLDHISWQHGQFQHYRWTGREAGIGDASSAAAAARSPIPPWWDEALLTVPPAKPEDGQAVLCDEALPTPAEPMLPPQSQTTTHQPHIEPSQAAALQVAEDQHTGAYIWQGRGRQKKSKGASTRPETADKAEAATVMLLEAQTGDKNQAVTAEEKVRQRARDRNRRHARNTRLRKKIYIEQLEKSVSDLTESIHAQHQNREDRSVAKRVADTNKGKLFVDILEDVLSMHSSRETDPRKWKDVITDDFVLQLPITPYRSFSPHEVEPALWTQTGSSTNHTSSSESSGKELDPAQLRIGHATQGMRRIVLGVEGVIRDACSLDQLLQSLVNGNAKTPVHADYQLATDPIVKGNVLMCRWTFCTQNAVACGAHCEVSIHGMLRASFRAVTPEDGLSEFTDAEALPLSPPSQAPVGASQVSVLHLDMLFDVMGFMQVLCAARQTSIPICPPKLFVVPNTLVMAIGDGDRWYSTAGAFSRHHANLHTQATSAAAHQGRRAQGQAGPQHAASGGTGHARGSASSSASSPSSTVPKVITRGSSPFIITHVNHCWLELCGYSHSEVLGKTLSLIQGPQTDKSAVNRLVTEVEQQHAVSQVIVNYKKNGSTFLNSVHVFPLWSEEAVTHMMAITSL